MFFCAISGEPPQDPVVSSKSGHVYERRLILKYITENGTDPVTGEKLEESDLVSVKASMHLPGPLSYIPFVLNIVVFRSEYCASTPTYTIIYPSIAAYTPK
jgi:pre-mRNA-processing factor 19